MEILLARHSGFCFGVQRALKIALEAADKQHPVYTLGPLIHNPQMVRELSEKGIIPVEKPDDLHDNIVIVRSHGITLSDKEKLIGSGNTLIDATCPFVSKAQDYIGHLCENHYPLIILGDKDHPEVIAMLSYCSGEAYVVGSTDELPDKQWQKLGVLSQTTKSIEMLQNLGSALIPKVQELKLFNTICTATSLRQEASISLARISDLMIVIGGKNSSNTKMLAALCAGITQVLHVETADELSAEQISSRQRIGLTAGASTPDSLIVDVYNKINQLTGNRTPVNSVENIPVYKEESC